MLLSFAISIKDFMNKCKFKVYHIGVHINKEKLNNKMQKNIGIVLVYK